MAHQRQKQNTVNSGTHNKYLRHNPSIASLPTRTAPCVLTSRKHWRKVLSVPQSPFGAAVFFIAKKDGTLRLVTDY
ncbi:hypothetical protein DSO57_1026118 [Entomophthora muscae]|uniref:Uncharacterized protein n=1 Tax=Entomophthora muscae TaxID=34485 RepID=A0ACC2SEV2_9FUNG|nr:hypothetical protein DSO57_1026118 [Entomophthora muscae]